MSKVQLLRLVGPNGQGVFQHWDAIDAYYLGCTEHLGYYPSTHPADHPDPDRDGLFGVFKPGKHLCAFRDFDQLLLWFPHRPAHRQLDEHDIRLLVLEVDEKHVHYGREQVIYDPDYATEIEFKRI